MGLVAVVYRNVRNVPDAIRRDGVESDPITGQVSLTNDRPDPPGGVFKAARCHLGNVAQIAFLRETIEDRCKNGFRIILGKILYSGTHGGDQIDPHDFAALRREIHNLRKMEEPEWSEFVGALETLLDAGESERNPIVFV